MLNHPDKKRIAFSNKALQTRLARELCQNEGVDHTVPTGIDKMRLFENATDTQIIVVDANAANAIVYRGVAARPNKIHLLHHNRHFDVIKSMQAFFVRSYYCENCLKVYNTLSSHRCDLICSLCYTRDC